MVISPESSLLLAVLMRGVLDSYDESKGIDRATRRYARFWISEWDERQSAHPPFSFPWICSELGFSATSIRHRCETAWAAGISVPASHCNWTENAGRLFGGMQELPSVGLLNRYDRKYA